MKNLVIGGAAAAVLALSMTSPVEAPARTKTILKYGAIGLGAYALSQAMQPSYGYGHGYYQQPSYYYAPQPSYGYYSYPSSGYDYSYGYGYDPGYYGGYYYGH